MKQAVCQFYAHFHVGLHLKIGHGPESFLRTFRVIIVEHATPRIGVTEHFMMPMTVIFTEPCSRRHYLSIMYASPLCDL